MKNVATLVCVAGFALCAQLPGAFADEIPALDVRKLCHADAQADATDDITPGSCVADEQRAHKDLVTQWMQFPPENRRRCVAVATEIEGIQSYVELLSCLQMAQDAKSLPPE